MKGFCIYTPNAPHTNKPSNLFTRLQQEFGRKNAIAIWGKLSTEEFYTKYARKNPLTLYDENGEILFESALEYINLDKVLDIEKLRLIHEQNLNTDVPVLNIGVVHRVNEFNKNNPLFTATVEDLPYGPNSTKMSIKVAVRDEVNQSQVEHLQKAEETYNAIDNFLSSLGIDIKILDANRFNGEAGLMLPHNLQQDTNSVFGVVNIANNIEGFNSLPEEFGHFLIECIKDNPLVQRSIKYLSKTPGLIEEILGQDYAQVVDYYTNKGREDLIATEALGRLLIQDINTGKIFSSNPNAESWLGSKVNNLKANVKYIFKLRNASQTEALQAIRETIVPIAAAINDRNDKLKSILDRFSKYGDSLAHAKADLSKLQTIFKNDNSLLQKARNTIGANIAKFNNIYRNVDSIKDTIETLNKEFQKFSSGVPKNLDTSVNGLKALSDDLDTEAVLQIGDYLLAMNKLMEDRFNDLKVISEEAVDSDYKLILKRASELRMIKDFIDLNKNCTEAIFDLLKSLANLEGDEYAQYRKYGTELMEHYKSFLSTNSNLESEYLQVGTKLMRTVLLPLFSPSDMSGVIDPDGFFRPTKASLALDDILEYSMGDISGLSRMCNAYYDMGDPYLNLIHYFIRRQQEHIRQNCQEAQKELRKIANEYKAETGSYDMSWAYERDANGKLTGYFRNAEGIDFRAFYNFERQYKKELNEKYGYDNEKVRSEFDKFRRKYMHNQKITTYKKNFANSKLELVEDSDEQIVIEIPVYDSRWASSGPALNSTQIKYLNKILEFKNKCDQLLPSHVVTRGGAQYYKCIQRTAGGITEAVMNGKDGLVSELGNVLKDKVLVTQQDDELGNVNKDYDPEYSEDEVTDSLFNRMRFKRKIDRLKKHVIENYRRLSTSLDNTVISNQSNLSVDDFIDSANQNQVNINRSRTTNEGYWIMEEDGVEHLYKRMHEVMGSMYKEGQEPVNSNTDSLDAGNVYDSVYRQYFSGVPLSSITKPEMMSDKAWQELKRTLPYVKKQMERDGTRFLANNIVLYHKFEDGTRVAGEVDIIGVDKNGKVVIYDVKTTRGKLQGLYANKSNKVRSTIEQYRLQVSGYQDLLELQYGMPVKDLRLLVNFITIDDDHKITEHRDIQNIPVTYNSEIATKMTPGVQRNRTHKLPIEEYDNSHIVQTTMDNKEYKRIPMYFVKNLMDVQRLSTDVFTSLSEYANMAYTFNGRHEIVDIVELAVTIGEARKMKQVVSDGTLVENVKAYLGNDAVRIFQREVKFSSENSNIVKALKSLRDKAIYGEYSVNDKYASVGEISATKAANLMLRYVAFSMLAYNMFTGINNLSVGKYQTMIEAAAGEYFSWKEWMKAEGIINANLVGFVKDYMSDDKSNKLWLFNELFNVDQNWKKVLEGQAFFKSGLMKLADIIGPSFMMEAGEKNLKLTTGVAMALAYKLKRIDANGKESEVSLWDALEVKEGVNGSNTGLVLSGGPETKYYKPDGTEFSFENGNVISKSDVTDFTLRVCVVNHRMHGVYNSEDLMEAKRHLWGKFVLMYRNFIFAPGFKRNIFADPHYNFILKQFEESFTRTTARFAMGALARPRTGENAVSLSEYKDIALQSMTTHQKANLKRFLFEFGSIFSTMLILNVGLGGWEDHKGEWGTRALYYFLRRLSSEQSFYFNPNSMMEILQSPVPALGPWTKLTKLFNTFFDQKVLESGPYKGYTNTYAALMRALPVYGSFNDFINLANSDSRFKIYNR